MRDNRVNRQPLGRLLFKSLLDKSVHQAVLMLAIPMVLSNITVPLLGLVDAAVIGHLDQSWYLGGVALGSTMISVTFWLLGFLRMSSTGLAAQFIGSKANHSLALILVQGLLMAFGLATLFLLLHSVIADVAFSLSHASDQVKFYGQQYFTIRAWSAPAAFANFVLLGWLLGTQNAKAAMWIVITTNVMNIIFDLLFVVVFDWEVQGAAFASVLADYIGSIVGLYFVHQRWRTLNLPSPFFSFSQLSDGIGRFIALNRDIFLRSLCLQITFSFMAFQGANFGDDIVAANAILMSFLMLISYGMDGLAYAIEAIIGKAVGAKDRSLLLRSLISSFFWGMLICIGLTAIFAYWGSELLGMISDIPSVQAQAIIYLPWLIAMPLTSMWAYLFDGIFVGATKGREMRNSMFIATLVFLLLYFIFSAWQNHALWFAMWAFMLLRGVGLAIIFIHQWYNDRFFIT